MGFWTIISGHQKIIKKLLHDVSLLIDLSALRDAVKCEGLAEKPVDNWCEVDKFRTPETRI
jgi:hypothetical protein